MRFAMLFLFASLAVAGEAQYTVELNDGVKIEVASYMTVGAEHLLKLPDGSRKTIKVADVSEIVKRKSGEKWQPAAENFDAATAKNEVLFHVLKDRMNAAYAKGRNTPVPAFATRRVSNGSIIITEDNSEQIKWALGERQKCYDEIILANKLLLVAITNQVQIDLAINKRDNNNGPIMEPQMPQVSLVSAAQPTRVTIDAALKLNAMTAQLEDDRLHWMLAMKSGGLFNGKYVPIPEDVQYVRNFLKWQAYKLEQARQPTSKPPVEAILPVVEKP